MKFGHSERIGSLPMVIGSHTTWEKCDRDKKQHDKVENIQKRIELGKENAYHHCHHFSRLDGWQSANFARSPHVKIYCYWKRKRHEWYKSLCRWGTANSQTVTFNPSASAWQDGLNVIIRKRLLRDPLREPVFQAPFAKWINHCHLLPWQWRNLP